MDITLNIPVQVPNSVFSVAELRKALEEYATLWVARAHAKELNQESELKLPAKFEKLCGSISQEKLNQLAETEKCDYIVSRNVKDFPVLDIPLLTPQEYIDKIYNR